MTTIEPVEEIFTEAAFFDHRGKVAVGGGDNAGLDGHAVRCADGADLLLLQGAQQLGLKVEGELADLVEEYRASLGSDERPSLDLTAPVKAPLT